jgi:hypothetical protein
MELGTRGFARRGNRSEGLSMIYFLALVPATVLTIAGYAVLFLAHRSEGALKSFGRYLGFWAFTLAALVVLGAILAAARGENMRGMPMPGYAGGERMRECPYVHSWRRPPPGGAPQGMPGARPLPPPGTPEAAAPK